jgi:hypothetical protein
VEGTWGSGQHQGPALRHGHGIDPCQHPGTPRPSVAAHAFAIMLLTLLETLPARQGYDRYLKSNTTKRRTHSLFRQGCMLYDLIPNVPKARLLPQIERFAAMLADLPVFADTLGGMKMRGSRKVRESYFVSCVTKCNFRSNTQDTGDG